MTLTPLERGSALCAGVAIVLCALASLLPAPALAGERLWPGEARYELDVRFDAERSSLSGSQRIEFVNTGPRALDAVWLRLWAFGPGGCRSRGISIDLTEGAVEGRRSVGCTALEARLPTPLAPGARTSIALDLHITAPTRRDRFGRVDGIAFFGNAIPTLAVMDARGPRLPPYVDFGEAWTSQAAAWRVRLTVPQGLEAATTGAAESEEVAGDGSRTVTYVAQPARDFGLALGRLVPISVKEGATRVTVWRGPLQRERDARRALLTARRAVRRFAAAWGPYGAAELDVVGWRPAGGMEYPELVFTSLESEVVAHEVAHQWWWGIVGNDQYRDPWLDESLASYADLRFEGVRARDICPDVDRVMRQERVPKPAAPLSSWRNEPDAYGFSVYGAGGCAWLRLEAAWGRPPLDAALRRYVAAQRFAVARPSDLLAALRAEQPRGKGLGDFQRRIGLRR